MTLPEDSTRSRIVVEATRLFADDGIKATTIARIEAAVGLRPGSGGVHRYFATKNDLVRAVLEAQIETTEQIRDAAAARPEPTAGEDLEAYLRSLGVYILDQATRTRDGTLIGFREGPKLLEQFPDLRQRHFEAALRPIAQYLAATGSDDVDAEALAFLLVGPLLYHRAIGWLTNDTPLGITDDRLVHQWAATFAAVLGAAR